MLIAIHSTRIREEPTPIIRKSQGEKPCPGERIMTIGLRKDRLKNEPTTGNIRCGIIPHLIFRTAVGLANDIQRSGCMDAQQGGLDTQREAGALLEVRIQDHTDRPVPGTRSSRRSHCRRSWATGRNRWIGRSAGSLLRWSHGESFSGNRSCCRATPGRGEHARSKREAGIPIRISGGALCPT